MTKNAQYTQAERDLKKAVANHIVWLRGLLTQKGEVRAQDLEELFEAIMEVSDERYGISRKGSPDSSIR